MSLSDKSQPAAGQLQSLPDDLDPGRIRVSLEYLTGGFKAICEFGNITLNRPENKPETADNGMRIEIPFGRIVEFGKYKIRSTVLSLENLDFDKFKAEKSRYVEWFDLDKINGKIFARRRADGDAFRPIGMTGKKKIGKFLTNARTGYSVRKKLLVFEDDIRIIWLGPIRACQKTRVTENTKAVLELEMKFTDN